MIRKLLLTVLIVAIAPTQGLADDSDLSALYASAGVERTYLAAFEYGNRKTGEDVRTFWREGDLRISVREQVDFLRKVYLGTLPVQPESIDIRP